MARTLSLFAADRLQLLDSGNVRHKQCARVYVAIRRERGRKLASLSLHYDHDRQIASHPGKLPGCLASATPPFGCRPSLLITTDVDVSNFLFAFACILSGVAPWHRRKDPFELQVCRICHVAVRVYESAR